MKFRFALSSLLAGLLMLPTAGCGNQLWDSFKMGMFSYISGTLSSIQLPAQISDALVKTVITGFTGT